MKTKSALIVACCLVGTFTASAYLSKIRHIRDEIIYKSEKIPVLTVVRDIKAGDFITAADLEVRSFIKMQVSGRTISPEDIEIIAGRRVIHPIPQRDPILWTDFPEGPRVQHPSEKIPPGQRVLALPADEIHTLIHFISPGDTVDIISSTFDNSGDRLISTLIAKNIVIMGVGRQLTGCSTSNEEYPLSVSLLVDPEKALTILRASQVGEIHFLARRSDPFLKFNIQDNQTTLEKNLQGEKP